MRRDREPQHHSSTCDARVQNLGPHAQESRALSIVPLPMPFVPAS